MQKFNGSAARGAAFFPFFRILVPQHCFWYTIDIMKKLKTGDQHRKASIMLKTLQSSLKKFLQKMQSSFADYKVTQTVIILLTLYAAVISMIPYDKLADLSFYEYTPMRAMAFFAAAAFFIETALGEKKALRICAFVGAAILAAFFTYWLKIWDDYTWNAVVWWQEMPNYYRHVMYLVVKRFMNGYLLLLFVGSAYFCFRKSGVRSAEYALRVFADMVKVFIVYVILLIGVLIIAGIIDSLFLNGSSYQYLLESAAAILVTGWYLAPKCIQVLHEPENEPGSFMRTIIKYVLPSLSVCEIVIVYLYMLTIFLRWQMPSNEIFSIITIVFCFGMPAWIMAENYFDETRFSCLVSILPYIFAPLICMQAYSIGVRIYYYGMTPSRYMAVALILFEIAVILIKRFKGRHYEILLPFLCVEIVTALFAPGINMYSVSDRCQRSFLERYYEDVVAGRQLSELSYERMSGAYKYLKDEPYMKAVIEEYDICAEDFVEKLNGQDIQDSKLTEYETHYIHCCQMVGDLDIGGYREFSMLNGDVCYEKDSEELFVTVYPDENGEDKTVTYGSGKNVDFSAFRFVKRGTEEVITVDISDFAKECILYERENPDAGKEEMSGAMSAYNRIDIDSDTVLYLNHFEIRYYEGVRFGEPYFKWDKVNLGGMLITKKEAE